MESGASIALQNWLVYQDARSGMDETEEYLFPSCKTATWDEDYGFWHTFVLGMDSLTTCVFGSWHSKITSFKIHQKVQKCKSLSSQGIAAWRLRGSVSHSTKLLWLQLYLWQQKNWSTLIWSVQERTGKSLQHSCPAVLWFMWLWISLCMLGQGSSVSNVRISSSCRKKG